MNNEVGTTDGTNEGQEQARRKRRKRTMLPCPHCGVMMPVKEHRCTCCGQDIKRSHSALKWAFGLLFGFLFFSAAIYVATLWVK